MITLLEQMNVWHWLALGLVLLLLELLGTAGYLLWLGLSAMLVGLVLFLVPISWEMQWVSFAVFSLFTTWLWWRYQHKKDRVGDDARSLNQRTEQLVGQTCVLNEDFSIGQGRLQLGDTTWSAKSEANIPAGTLVEVVRVEGIVLVIEEKARQ
ncbi:NfeD family protein [Photobacterium sanctipauli]|uniref:NfeD family protein n=1 Tax=Photobacterium sanctipauli TaxID=1342794 RepID=A0A2T3NWI3_9GAMM|nr:NfeD family protein [Photobacterium sanctipauli]PSW20611.1 NfeD family protein [Photobacterium sanctipauli]